MVIDSRKKISTPAVTPNPAFSSSASRYVQKQQLLRNKMYSRRFKLLFWGLIVFVACILAKLFYIQVIDASHLKKMALQSRPQALTLYNRGRILDCNGKVLAEDTVLYDLYMHPKHYNARSPREMAKVLATILEQDEDTLYHKLMAPDSTILVQKNLSKQTVEKINQARVPILAKNEKTGKLLLRADGRPEMNDVRLSGLDFSKKNVRSYPEGSLAAHVLGYVNDEAMISSGVESVAARTLKKKPANFDPIFLDGNGNLLGLAGRDPKNIVSTPKAKDVRLTLDAHLQYIAERELVAGIQRSRAERGSVLMLDPKTGSILAYAVSPTFQPDRFYKANPSVLKNWSLSDVYPPGSTFKILTIASGLENKVINPATTIEDTGIMSLGGWTIQNYDYSRRGVPGTINLVDLLVHSSNVASAKIALMIPREKHFEFLKTVGIGSKTNIDLPGESAGLIKSLDTWDQSTHGSIGYGYGVATTALQMAAAVSAIANNGIWNTPHVMMHSPVEHRRVMTQQTSLMMRELLAKSIAQPKNSPVRVEGTTVAGKTGTSRKPNANGSGYSKEIYTSFVGFFPVENPQVLIMVVIDSPHMAEAWGSTVAGPIFKNIATETLATLKTTQSRQLSGKGESMFSITDPVSRHVSSTTTTREEVSHAAAH
jgi:cell division protein FtsI (penicillin-binding protein 3)